MKAGFLSVSKVAGILLCLIFGGVNSEKLGLSKVFDVLKSTQFFYRDDVLRILPMDGWDLSVELLYGSLKGVDATTPGQDVVTGWVYRGQYGHNGRQAIRTYNLETETCSRLSPMLGKMMLKGVMTEAFKMSAEQSSKIDVCSLKITVPETKEMYEIRFRRGAFEVRISMGEAKNAILQDIFPSNNGVFGFKLKIKIRNGKIELDGTDVNDRVYVTVKPENIHAQMQTLVATVKEIGVLDSLRILFYIDEFLGSFRTDGVVIVNKDIDAMVEQLWMSGEMLLKHFLSMGRETVKNALDELLDRDEAIRVIELVAEKVMPK